MRRRSVASSSACSSSSLKSDEGDDGDGNDNGNGFGGSVVEHYNSHRQADSYEDAYFYEPGPYAEDLRYKVQGALLGLTRPARLLRPADARAAPIDAPGCSVTAPKPPRILLDVGGGTGSFTRMLLQGTRNVQAVVVDPFLVDEAPIEGSSPSGSPPVRFVKAGAEQFMRDGSATDGRPSRKKNRLWWQSGYHHVLMKEMIHHVKAEDRVPIFRGLREGLDPLVDATQGDATPANERNGPPPPLPPSLLIVTRPQLDIDYPLWDAARAVWASQQPSLEEIVRDLEAAGFARVSSTTHSYPCEIALSRWKRMVKNRFWSTFSHFTDAELDEGILQLESFERGRGRDRLDEDGVLRFEDRLLFISAHAFER